MIGIVTDQYRAMLHLTVRGPDGQEQEVEVVLDTGFDGHLTLPSAAITTLGLNYTGESITTLADGHAVELPFYEAVVLWDGQERSA
jgi:predicted aspartyl protease